VRNDELIDSDESDDDSKMDVWSDHDDEDFPQDDDGWLKKVLKNDDIDKEENENENLAMSEDEEKEKLQQQITGLKKKEEEMEKMMETLRKQLEKLHLEKEDLIEVCTKVT